MKLESTFSIVVLPAPVPPETMTLRLAPTAAFRKSSIGCGQRFALDQILRAKAVGPETPDRHERAVEGERRDDHVDARSVLQPRVDHRAGFVDAPAHGADDPLDDLQQMPVVTEHDVGLFELAFPLDVDLVVPC